MSFDRIYSKPGMFYISPEANGSTVGGIALGTNAGVASGSVGGASYNVPTPATGSATAVDTGGTIAHNGAGVVRVATSSAADKTGVIVAAGTFPGQSLVIVNNSGNKMTMASTATSNVANGTSCVLHTLSAIHLVWEPVDGKWYQVRGVVTVTN